MNGVPRPGTGRSHPWVVSTIGTDDEAGYLLAAELAVLRFGGFTRDSSDAQGETT